MRKLPSAYSFLSVVTGSVQIVSLPGWLAQVTLPPRLWIVLEGQLWQQAVGVSPGIIARVVTRTLLLVEFCPDFLLTSCFFPFISSWGGGGN